MTVEKDAWLASIFGYDVYRVTLVDGGLDSLREEIASVLEEDGQRRRAFLFARAATERVDLLHALSGLGFQVVDVNVTFERSTSHGAMPVGASTVKVCLAEPRHQGDVLRIAGSCFRYSRFHLDPLVPDGTADGIKRAWVSSYIQGLRGEALWIALIDGRPVGFAAMLAQESGGMRRMVIDLIGVDTDHHGQGVGTQMVASVVDAYAQKCDRVIVGTQAANIPSMRLYERCGFRVASTTYVLHLHSGGEAR